MYVHAKISHTHVRDPAVQKSSVGYGNNKITQAASTKSVRSLLTVEMLKLDTIREKKKGLLRTATSTFTQLLSYFSPLFCILHFFFFFFWGWSGGGGGGGDSTGSPRLQPPQYGGCPRQSARVTDLPRGAR